MDKYVVKFTKSKRKAFPRKISMFQVARSTAKGKARTSGRATYVENAMTGKKVFKCTSKAKCKIVGRTK